MSGVIVARGEDNYEGEFSKNSLCLFCRGVSYTVTVLATLLT